MNLRELQDKMNEKIILYLTFAKTKLDMKCETHRKAKEDIDKIIQELQKEN